MKHTIEPLWRPAYEIGAAVTWALTGVVMLLVGNVFSGLAFFPIAMACLCWLFSLIRISQVLVLWEKKARIAQSDDYTLSGPEIMKKVEKARKLAKKGRLRLD
jgi:hypothetical protein